MSPRYDGQWIDSMLNIADRLGPNQPEDILVRTGLGEAHTVVDLGCGPGLMTIPAANVVGSSGRVHAVDIEQKMLDLIDDQASKLNLSNISTVSISGGSVPLADGIADYAICGLILHDPQTFESRVDMAKDVLRLLRPTGRMLIIERGPQTGDSHGHQLTPDQTRAILQEAGMDIGEPQTLVGNNYMMVATPKSPF